MKRELILRVAAVLALVGLALMVWSVLDPSPLSVMLAMTLGQGIGTLSLLSFLVVVLADLRRRGVLDDDPKGPP